MKTLRNIIAVAIFAAYLTLIPMNSANAAGDGCGGPRYDKLDQWSRSEYGTNSSGKTFEIILSGALEYVLCNVESDKIKYKSITLCYSFPVGYEPVFFNGVSYEAGMRNKYNSEYWGDKYIDVGRFSMPEGSGRQDCQSFSLLWSQIEVRGNNMNQWWSLSSTPYWQVDFEVRWTNATDNIGYFDVPQWIDFYSARLKRIFPQNDTTLGGPY